MDKYYAYTPSGDFGRIYVCTNDEKGRRSNLLTMYQWGEHGQNRKGETADLAKRIAILLSAFDGVSTETLESELFSIAARLKKEAAG